MKSAAKKSRLLGATLLVSGTTIGGGVLALPVTTGVAGFFPSLLLLCFVWAFMMLTAFYLLEVNLRLPGETNLISMMKKTVGKPGEVLAWVTYLLLLYALLSAYLLGCSHIISNICLSFFCYQLPLWTSLLILFVIFSAFVYFGTHVIDVFNRFLMVGLVLGYLGVVLLGLPHIKASFLLRSDWPPLIHATSIIITSFGYHIIIPSLTTYLEHDPKLLKKSILYGSLIPLIFYLLWQFVSLGIVPLGGALGIEEAAKQGQQITFSLQKVIGNPWVSFFSTLFALFAILTSLLGVSLSLSDFLADGLKIKKNHLGKLLLILLTYIPPLLFAFLYPKGYIAALNYAGFFVVTLLIFCPALMAWFERYLSKQRNFLPFHYKVPGGKKLLGATMIGSLFLMGLQLWI